jgi:hypothetical protein
MLALLALVQSSFESAWRAEEALATSGSRRAAVARIGVPYRRGQEQQGNEERGRLGDPQRQAAA